MTRVRDRLAEPTLASAAARGDRAGTRLLALLVVVSSILFVALATQLPVTIYSDAGHDDAWFWQRAKSMVAGHWMGDYNHMTLMKGSGYPLFLVLSHASGLSMMTTQALLYCAACLLLAAAVHRISRRPWLPWLLVLALQWHPTTMNWNRVLRDNLGPAQVLIGLACLLLFLYAAQAGRRGWRWALLSGLAFAWLWTTREDAVWIVPGIALLVLARLAQAWRDRDERRRLVIGSAWMAVAFAGWLSLVATVNLVKYGVFATVETRETAFVDALSALQRVRVGEPVAYVPVPRDVREAVYAVSPAFALLRPHFDGAGMQWAEAGCDLSPQACGDYAGGWFMWVFRDAATTVDAYRSAQTADAYYRQIADEVDRACDDGRLRCTRALVAMMPPVPRSQWQTAPARVRKAVSLLFWGIRDGQGGSHTASPGAREMWRFVGEPKVPDPADTLGGQVSGWYYGPQPGWLQLRCAASGAIAVERQASADIAGHFGDPAAGDNRFAFTVPAIDGCALESTATGDSVRLSEATATARDFTLGPGQVHFDTIHAGIPRDAETPAATWRIRHWIARAYRAALPWLAAAGALAFAWASARALRMRRLQPLYLLAASAWCLTAARVALLVLVDLSSFAALKVHYLTPAMPLLVVAALVSLALVLPDRGRAAITLRD